jgi:hypothetical protein
MLEQRFVSSRIFVLILASAASFSCGSRDLSNKRAIEGRGLLERPVAVQSLAAVAPAHAFHAESLDLSSRELFETSENPKFTLRVREFSLPPRRGPISTTFTTPVFLEMRTDRGTLKIGGNPQLWKQGALVTVPAHAPIELGNPTDRELIVRLYIAEAK